MNSIHPTWKAMEPSENEGYYFDNYYERMLQLPSAKNIPKAVFKQWIFSLHSDYFTLQNYAWMDFSQFEFKLCKLEYKDLINLYVIEDFRKHVSLRASYHDFTQFCCTDEDLEHWRKFGTWTIPPIILKTNSIIGEIPDWSEISEFPQLVEGHSRFGYLQSLKTISKLGKANISEKHEVFIMQQKY